MELLEIDFQLAHPPSCLLPTSALQDCLAQALSSPSEVEDRLQYVVRDWHSHNLATMNMLGLGLSG